VSAPDYADFDLDAVAAFGAAELERLMGDAAIVRREQVEAERERVAPPRRAAD
jgi:3-methyladenine DNA glycosylase Tag